MIKQLGNNIVFVTGAVRSAIYDFRTGKVYSLNETGTRIIINAVNNNDLNEKEADYVSDVCNLLSVDKFHIDDYVFPDNHDDIINFAWLEVTQKCSCRCIHCYEGDVHNDDSTILDFDDWKRVIAELTNVGCKAVCFIGGEPTLYSRLAELITYSRQSGIEKIYVFSNLFNISDKLLKTFKDNNVTVRFSIYGADAETHDSITKTKGSFEKMLKNISAIKENGIELGASIVLMKENETERDKIRNLLTEIGIEHIHSDEVRLVYNGTQNSHLVTESKMNMTKPNFKANKLFFDCASESNTCWHGKIAVSTTGQVFPCEFERNISYGNVKEFSISQILNGKDLQFYWHLNSSMINVCKDCEYRFACKDCRPLGYAMNGNILDKKYRCKYNPYQGEWNTEQS